MNDDDDSFTQDTRNRDSFYRAQKWVLGEAELMQGTDSTTLHKSHAVQMDIFGLSQETPRCFKGNANNTDDTDLQGSVPFVDISQMSVSAPWVEVEIPVLNKLALKESSLPSHYGKTAPGNIQKFSDAVHLLRRALGVHCFESTVRAIYDLSRCYRHGIGINLDFSVAKVLRYCASGLRRNYDSRAIWLRGLALEVACFPHFPVERGIISLMFFSRQALTSLVLHVDQSPPGGSITGIRGDSDISKTRDDIRHTDFEPLLRFDQQQLRTETTRIPDSMATQTDLSTLLLSLRGTLSGSNSPAEVQSSMLRYDVFISHAGEDRPTVALPLRKKLGDKGITAFVDETDLLSSTEAQECFSRALETSKVAVIVLSPEYVAEHSMVQLYLLQRRFEERQFHGTCRPVIIPFFYRLSIADLYHSNLDGMLLFGESRYYERMDAGELDPDIENVRSSLRKLHDMQGVENYVNASNETSLVMEKRRALLLQDITNQVRRTFSEEEDSPTFKNSQRSNHEGEFRPFFDKFLKASRLVLDFDSKDQDGKMKTTEGRILQALLDGSSNASSVIGIKGCGGVGKTCILRSLSTMRSNLDRYTDGIYFIPLGDVSQVQLIEELNKTAKKAGRVREEDWRGITQDLIKEDELGVIHDWIREDKLGIRQGWMQDDIRQCWMKAFSLFRSWFSGKRCLFLIDDLWVNQEISSQVIDELLLLHESGSDSKLVFTTRSTDILARAATTFHLETLNPRGKKAWNLLCHYSCVIDREILSTARAIDKILEMCGGLPLCIAIAGKSLTSLHMQSGLTYRESLLRYAATIEKKRKVFRNANMDLLISIFSTAIHLVEDAKNHWRFQVSCTAAEMYRRLSVLQRQARVPMSMLRHLWELPSETDALMVAREFESLSLADIDLSDSDLGFIEVLHIHDSLYDFAKLETRKHGEERLAHQVLLQSYGIELEIEQGCRAWWSTRVVSDGYIHHNLSRHLLAAGRHEELVTLLLRHQWIARMLEVCGVLQLERDYRIAIAVLQRAGAEGVKLRDDVKALQIIAEAVRLSAWFIAQNPKELCFQLYGRLKVYAEENDVIKSFLDRMVDSSNTPCVQCTGSSLSGPGSSLSGVISLDAVVESLIVMEGGTRVACVCGGGIAFVDLKKCTAEKGWLDLATFRRFVTIDEHETKLITGSENETATIWNMITGRKVAEFEDLRLPIQCVAVTKDGRHVVSGSFDGSVQVRDVDTGKVVTNPGTGHDGRVLCLTVAPDGERVISGGSDRSLRIWRTASTLQEEQTLYGHTDYVNCVAVSSDGRVVVSGSSDRTIRVWNLGSDLGVPLGRPFHGHSSDVTSVAINDDGSRIVSGSHDKTIRIWDVKSGQECCAAIRGHARSVTGVAFLAGSERLISCSRDGTIRVWDATTREFRKHIDQHDGLVSDVAFTPDGSRAVSASHDKTVRVWDVESGRQIGTFLAHPRIVSGVASDGLVVVSVGFDNVIRVWDLESHEMIRCFTGHTDVITCVAMTNDGRYAVTGSFDETVRVWDVSGAESSDIVLKGHSYYVTHVFLSDDARHIISTSVEEIIVWDMATRRKVEELRRKGADLLSRRELLDLFGFSTSIGITTISVTPGSAEILWDSGKEDSAQVVGTLEANVTVSDASADGFTICAGLENGQIVFLKMNGGDLV